MLSNKTYDALEWIAMYLLPALTTDDLEAIRAALNV